MLLPSAQWLSAVYRPSGAELYLMSLIPSPACLPATKPPFLSRWFWGILLGGNRWFQVPCGPHAPARLFPPSTVPCALLLGSKRQPPLDPRFSCSAEFPADPPVARAPFVFCRAREAF